MAEEVTLLHPRILVRLQLLPLLLLLPRQVLLRAVPPLLLLSRLLL